jgi:hypothetical protein
MKFKQIKTIHFSYRIISKITINKQFKVLKKIKNNLNIRFLTICLKKMNI